MAMLDLLSLVPASELRNYIWSSLENGFLSRQHVFCHPQKNNPIKMTKSAVPFWQQAIGKRVKEVYNSFIVIVYTQLHLITYILEWNSFYIFYKLNSFYIRVLRHNEVSLHAMSCPLKWRHINVTFFHVRCIFSNACFGLWLFCVFLENTFIVMRNCPNLPGVPITILYLSVWWGQNVINTLFLFNCQPFVFLKNKSVMVA